MTVRDAAAQVLTEAGEPLHYRELTRRMVESGLWTPGGRTPEATVVAQLSAEIGRRGSESRFRRAGRGIYGLNDGAPEPDETRLSFTDAAEQVLEGFAEHRPMHYRAITQKSLELGLIATEGKTPEATMYAQLFQEIQRYERRGDQPRFERQGRGLFALTRWHGEGLAYQIAQHNAEVRQHLLERIKEMDPSAFEELIAELLVALGFDEVEVTARHNDGGIDVRGMLVVGEVVRTRMAVQVKRWRNNVQAPTVQQVRGALAAHEQGLIITTSNFGIGARSEAERPGATPVGLMNGEQLVAVLVENDIEVRRTSHDLIELDEHAEGS